jgi:hypothetical protein
MSEQSRAGLPRSPIDQPLSETGDELGFTPSPKTRRNLLPLIRLSLGCRGLKRTPSLLIPSFPSLLPFQQAPFSTRITYFVFLGLLHNVVPPTLEGLLSFFARLAQNFSARTAIEELSSLRRSSWTYSTRRDHERLAENLRHGFWYLSNGAYFVRNYE